MREKEANKIMVKYYLPFLMSEYFVMDEWDTCQ